MFADWELLVKDPKTGRAVWAVTGVYEGITKWSVIILREIDPTVARAIFPQNFKKPYAKDLFKNLSDNGFESLYGLKKGKIKWYFMPKKAQIEMDLEGIV